MPDQPLQPFAPPTAFLDALHLSGIVTATQLVWWFLYAICFFWVVYTLVATYHWVRYSHGAWLALPAIALHLVVSYALIVYALTGAFMIPFL